MRVRDKHQISRSVKMFGKLAGKLMALAVAVFILWVVRVGIAAAQEPIIANFHVDAKTWSDCMTVITMTKTYVSQVVSCVSKQMLPRSHVYNYTPCTYVFDFLTHSSWVKWKNATRFRMQVHPCAFSVFLSKICRVSLWLLFGALERCCLYAKVRKTNLVPKRRAHRLKANPL
jgi:hypothetical protein